MASKLISSTVAALLAACAVTATASSQTVTPSSVQDARATSGMVSTAAQVAMPDVSVTHQQPAGVPEAAGAVKAATVPLPMLGFNGPASAETRSPMGGYHMAWNPWRSACATAVTAAAFGIGYWGLSRIAWAGTWLAGHYVESSVLKTMLGWFSWSWVYSVAYNDVC